MTDATSKEGLDLRKDGTASLWIDGSEYRIRRPKAGEFKRLRDDLQERIDQINECAYDGQRSREALYKQAVTRGDVGRPAAGFPDGEPLLNPDERNDSASYGKVLADLRERLTREWWTGVVALLTEKELDPEDVPPWLWDEDQTIVMIAHWRSVPLLSGAR